MRAAKANHVEEINMLINEIRKTSYSLRDADRMYFIDNLSEGHADVSAISILTGLSYDSLSSMTTAPVYQKFTNSNKALETPNFYLLKNIFEKTNRCYCPYCLRENGVYKLIWQIKNIEICDIHRTTLTSTCPKCGAVQPYISNYLGELKCHECMSPLYETVRDTPEYADEYLNNQLYLYRQWDYLLDNKAKGLTPNPKMNYEIQMACTLLFLLHNENNGILSFRNISPVERKKFYNFIKSKNKEVFINPHRLIRYLSQDDISVDQFFSTNIEQSFIDKLIAYLKMDEVELSNSETTPIKRMYALADEEKSTKAIKGLEEYLALRKPSGRLFMKEVYKNLPYSPSYISRETKEYIWDKVKEYNKQYWDNLIENIRTEVIDLLKKGEVPTYQKVADVLGLHVSYIKRNPELAETIKDVRAQYYQR